MKFDWNSTSHWSGLWELRAHPLIHHFCLLYHSPLIHTRQFEKLISQVHALSLMKLLHSQPMTCRIPIKLHLTGKSRLTVEFSHIKIGLSLMSCDMFSSASWINIWKNDLPFGKLNCRYNMTKNQEVFLKYIVYFQWIALLFLILLGHARTGF